MSPWVPRALLVIGAIALVSAIVSLSVGEGGPQPAKVGGVNDVQRIFGGIEQEGAYLGPSDAETTITVFNDIQCRDCAAYEIDTIDPLVETYARPGDARLEFRHFSLAPNDTTVAAIASEAAGMQDRQWQYLDTFVRNQDLASGRVDAQVLREVAEAVPELDVDQWQRDYESPASEELVRDDAMVASQLELTAEPAVVVAGPGGQRTLFDFPSREEIDRAMQELS